MLMTAVLLLLVLTAISHPENEGLPSRQPVRQSFPSPQVIVSSVAGAAWHEPKWSPGP